jgi:hypothetical protein
VQHQNAKTAAAAFAALYYNQFNYLLTAAAVQRKNVGVLRATEG